MSLPLTSLVDAMPGQAPYPVSSDGLVKPQHFRGITLDRLDQFEGGHFANIRDVLYEHRIDDQEHIQLEIWSSPGRSKTPFKEAVKQKFKPFQKGSEIGPSWTNHWFRVTIKLPKEWKDKERVQLEWDPSCEAMIFNDEGLPLQGITGGYGGDRRVDFILDPKHRGSTYKLYIESSCNGMFGNGSGETNNPPDDNRYFRVNSADLVVPRMEAWRLLWDFRAIKDLAQQLGDRSPLGNKCLEVGNAIMNVFLPNDLSTIAKARALAEKVLGKGWEKKGASIYKGDPSECQTWGVGNCHIDTAWLWPYSVTRQKTARSWSTQLDLMKRYPEHRFVASQAQQFSWLEQDYPLLFNEIKAKVASGEFIPIGASWVESDSNMPSGEALCRQLLHGQRFFKSRFGQYSRVYWLPDTFGYSSQVPQLTRLAGCDFFFTQKLSWSQFNDFPHSTFKWVGQDGSQIVTHMTPVNTYTAQASVGDIRNSIGNHKSLQSGADTGLLAFGNGDGGGGPLAPMLENMRRCRAIADKHGEIPKVTMGATVDQFYEDILAKTDGGKTLATWNGELYLELHRGTYTSHGAIKKGNRRSEILLRDVEYAATLASLHNSHYSYPKDKLDELWEFVLTNQFHDVLPGSGIHMIYEDAERIYADVGKQGGKLLEEALEQLAPGSVPLSDSTSTAESLLYVNTTGVPHKSVTQIPLKAARTLEGTVQLDEDGSAWALFDASHDRHADGQAISCDNTVEPARAFANKDGFTLSSSHLEVQISNEGRITSLVDKKLRRDLIADGKSAGFVIFQDHPRDWDAWDTDIYSLETKEQINATSVKVAQDGPLRAGLVATYHFGKSTIKTKISIDAVPVLEGPNSLPMIRFDTEVDWHERHRFLKFETPLRISSESATFENQFGCVQRPTTRNTTWDRAKFEVCGHKFADLSEFGYGVAVLNDCKYGYSALGDTLTLSLLRAATVPDAEQDQGDHEFAFAIQPHRGTFAESDVPHIARIFNSPPHLRKTAKSAQRAQRSHPFTLDGTRNVFLDTVKRGEDDHFLSRPDHSGNANKNDNGKDEQTTVILRFYEAYGGHGRATVSVPFEVTRASICDILERDLEEVKVKKVDGGKTSFEVELRGFQVLTVKLVVGSGKVNEDGWEQV